MDHQKNFQITRNSSKKNLPNLGRLKQYLKGRITACQYPLELRANFVPIINCLAFRYYRDISRHVVLRNVSVIPTSTQLITITPELK